MSGPRLLLAILVLSVSPAPVCAADRDPALTAAIAAELSRPFLLTIFDDVHVGVGDGVVRLTGRVTSPSKRDAIARRIARLAQVREVRNGIAVLPISASDDDLRHRIARGIYGNASFWNYAAMAQPSIRIIVERGHVTLAGTVRNEADRALARALATQFGARSVTVTLRTDAERREARGTSE